MSPYHIRVDDEWDGHFPNLLKKGRSILGILRLQKHEEASTLE